MIEQVLSTLVKEIFVGFDGTVTRVRDTPQIYTPNAMIKNKRTSQNTYGDFFDALDENTICKKDQLLVHYYVPHANKDGDKASFH